VAISARSLRRIPVAAPAPVVGLTSLLGRPSQPSRSADPEGQTVFRTPWKVSFRRRHLCPRGPRRMRVQPAHPPKPRWAIAMEQPRRLGLNDDPSLMLAEPGMVMAKSPVHPRLPWTARLPLALR